MIKTIQAILELAGKARAGEILALATVVNVRGSAYRRPGARMLVTSDGRSAGMISGGCLENDARERAQEVMAAGTPRLVTYDSTAPADIIFGLGLGCTGIVQVLIEPLTARDEGDFLAFLSACVARRQVGRVATVFQSDDFPLGARLLRWPDGRVTSTCGDDALSAALLQAFLETAPIRTAGRRVELPNGRAARVLIEAIAPSPSLTIFGAADDAVPVAQLAKLLGWHVTVIDARPAYATPERFPTADEVLCLRPELLPASPRFVLPPDSMMLIMTHNYTHDRALLRVLLPRATRYVGILGPRARTESLLQELAGEGITFTGEAVARLHGPAGLDVGAETPEEIAVSIVGEMQAVLAQREGGALRDRTGPIHEPTDQLFTNA